MTDSIETKDYHIESLILTPLHSDPIDLRNIFMEFSIFEDLYSNSVSGNILISDAANQIKNLPILGFETLTIKFNAPNKKSLSGTYIIYKISNREPDQDKSQMYVLNFCSKEQITEASVSVGKSYNGKLISDIANDLQTSFLNSSFFDLEPTKFLHSIIIPNTFSVFEAMNWLTTRANSNTYNGANYMYFQNQSGYNFTSLERLNSKPSVIEYVYGVANVRRSDQGNVTHKDRNYDLEQRSILQYNISTHIDVLANLTSGMYANRVCTYDFVNKKFGVKDYNYSDSYTKQVHTEPNNKFNILTKQTGPTKLITNKFQKSIDPQANLRFYVDNPSESFPNQVNNWLGQRIAQIQEINNITIKIVVPGDSERKIGETVSILLPSPEALLHDELQYDTYFQGKYLISGLRHVVQQGQYLTYMELVKDSVFSPIPN